MTATTAPLRPLQRSHAKHRRFASVALAASAICVASLGIAAPAQASPGHASEVFFSPNCQGASRVYNWEQHQVKEAWINDRFDQTRFGSAGYGQKIRNNAASIYVRGTAEIWINGQASVWYSIGGGSGGCFNFPADTRNNNVAFRIG